MTILDFTKADCTDSARPPELSPEAWHPSNQIRPENLRAVEVCKACPLASMCRTYAEEEGLTGIWGGVRYTLAGRPSDHGPDRVVPSPLTTVRAVVAACGTEAGYRRHKRQGEDACTACCEAAAAASKAAYERKKARASELLAA